MSAPVPDRSAARVAAPGEGVSHDELGLAARNHGMPALRLGARYRFDLDAVKQWLARPAGGVRART